MYLEESVRAGDSTAVLSHEGVPVVIVAKNVMDYKAGCCLYSYYAQFFKPFWFKNNIKVNDNGEYKRTK